MGATDLCKKYCYGNGVFRHSEDPSKKMLNTEAIARENYRITNRTLQDGTIVNVTNMIS